MLMSDLRQESGTHHIGDPGKDRIDEVAQEAEEATILSANSPVEEPAHRSQIAHQHAFHPQNVILMLDNHLSCT